ncbi:MAG TPA: hypothetical protein VFX21_16070, partial [Acidimicrobiia bacterium]|nr:hypothetical protein [Acidimicrobiia bacterium]
MSRQMGGRGNGGGSKEVARGAGFAAAKGAGLIALAVIIGIVLLNVVDDGSVNNDGASSTNTTTPTTAAATDSTGGGETTPTTVDDVPPKTPADLSVLVLNGGAPPRSAKSMSDALRLKDYTNQLEPADWQDHSQTGNTVMCKAGLDEEGAAL